MQKSCGRKKQGIFGDSNEVQLRGKVRRKRKTRIGETEGKIKYETMHTNSYK